MPLYRSALKGLGEIKGNNSIDIAHQTPEIKGLQIEIACQGRFIQNAPLEKFLLG